MNTVACIQARLGSTRLPAKMLEPIGGMPAIAHTAYRAEEAGYITCLLCPESDVAAFRSAAPGVNIFGWQGEEWDVLSRFAAFAESRPAVSALIRVTGDCPFIERDTIHAIGSIVTGGVADFATTNPDFGEPVIDGYDCEAFTRELLLEAHANAKSRSDREHVTPWMRRNAKRPWLAHRKTDGTRHRWTLDTADDLAWFRAVAAEINCAPPSHPTYEELTALIARKPELRRLNR